MKKRLHGSLTHHLHSEAPAGNLRMAMTFAWNGNSGRLTKQFLKINHHVQKELVDRISWELIMNELQV